MKTFFVLITFIISLNARVDVLERTKDRHLTYSVICVNGNEFLVVTYWENSVSVIPTGSKCSNLN